MVQLRHYLPRGETLAFLKKAFGQTYVLITMLPFWSLAFIEWRDNGFIDYLMLAGSMFLGVGVYFAAQIPRMARRMVRRLSMRGVIKCTESQIQEVENQLLHSYRKPTAWLFGLAGGVMVFISYKVAYHSITENDAWFFTIISSIGGGASFLLLYPTIITGGLIRMLQRENIPITVQPGHPDKASGLKPYGNFYLFQAFVILIPVIHLSLWWSALTWSAFSKFSESDIVDPQTAAIQLRSSQSNRFDPATKVFNSLSPEFRAFVETNSAVDPKSFEPLKRPIAGAFNYLIQEIDTKDSWAPQKSINSSAKLELLDRFAFPKGLHQRHVLAAFIQRHYSLWRIPYLILLFTVLPLEILAFAIPMWTCHAAMLQSKEKLLEHADVCGCEFMTHLKSESLPKNEDEWKLRKELMELKREEILRIDQMYSWPIDTKQALALAAGNAFPFFTFVRTVAKLLGLL